MVSAKREIERSASQGTREKERKKGEKRVKQTKLIKKVHEKEIICDDSDT